MKFSEAIRLGAMMKPQGHSPHFFLDGKTCALGAALDACGKLEEVNGSFMGGYTHVAALWPWTSNYMANPFPQFDHFTNADGQLAVWNIVTALNDCAKWTREEISAWVATIEPAQEPTSAEVTPVPVMAALIAETKR